MTKDPTKKNSFDTPNLYQSTTSIDRIHYFLKSYPQKSWSIKVLSNELDIPYNTVSQSLHRLKKRGIAINNNRLWRLKVPNKSSHTFDTTRGWGYSQVYQNDVLKDEVDDLSKGNIGDSKQALDLASFLLSYDAFHGIECHLPGVSNDTCIDPLEIDGRIYSLENRKYRIKSSNLPITFDEADQIQGIIKSHLATIGYGGPVWLTHIELNRDLEGYKLDGAQRIEVRTLLGTIYRMYNKKVGGKQYLRSEAIQSFKSGKLSLDGAFYTLVMVRDLEDTHTVNQILVKETKKVHREAAYGGQQLKIASDQINGQIEQVVEGLENKNLVERQQLGELRTHTQQNEVTNQRLGEIINQHDLTRDQQMDSNELLRQIRDNQVAWRELASHLQRSLMIFLRQMNQTYDDIAKLLGYAHKSGPYNWINRNIPEAKNIDNINSFDNTFDTHVYPHIRDKEVSVLDNSEISNRFDTPFDTTRIPDVYPSKSLSLSSLSVYFDNLQEIYNIQLGDTQLSVVTKVLEVHQSLTTEEVKAILPHIAPSSIGRTLSNLAKSNSTEVEYYTDHGKRHARYTVLD